MSIEEKMGDVHLKSRSPDEDDEPDYKTPNAKPLTDILAKDDEDEALKKYKEKLLGSAATGETVEVFPDDPRQVIVRKLILIVEGKPYREIDLSQSLEEIKKKKFILKEGCKFKIQIDFYVQRDIVSGLKYVQKTSRMGITVDKMKKMVGSYGPKKEIQSVTTDEDDAPSGIAARGSYSVHSVFTDDDKNEYLKWDWNIEVKKNWDEES